MTESAGEGGHPDPSVSGTATAGGLEVRTWILLACALHVVLGGLLYEPTLFTGGDNAGYMILGEALGGGHGYRDLYLPETPLHTKYPPFYPGVLAVLGWFGGLQLFKVASLALTTTAVGLTGLLGRRWIGGASAVFLAFLMAVNPLLLDYGHWVLSEAPFVALVLASLVALEGMDVGGLGPGSPQGEPTRRTDPGPDPSASRLGSDGVLFALGVAAAAAAFLTRTAGLPLLVAVALWPALERWPRRAGAAALVVVATAAGWALYQHMAAPARPGYLGELLLVDPYRPEAGRIDVAGIFLRGMENLWQYVSAVLPTSLGLGGSGGARVDPLSLGTGVVVTGLALGGWVGRARRRLGPSELFVFLYVGLIAAWPSVWTDRRFLLPVLPLVLAYATLAAGRLVARLGEGDRPPISAVGTGALAMGLALVGLVDAAGEVPQRFECQMGYAAGEPCVSPAYRSFYDAARWTGENLPPDAVVVNRKPRLFYLQARRRGFVYPYVSEPELVLREIERRGADHVVLDALSGTTARYLVPAVQEHPGRFEVLYRRGEPPTWVLRYRPPPETARRDVGGGAEARGP